MKRVFLGGTCNNSKWRQRLIPSLKIDYFNPVVDDWNEEAQAREIKQRQTCDFCLYTITPRMTGVYSIAQVIDDSNKRPQKTLFYYCNDYDDDNGVIEFSPHQIKSLKQVAKMVETNGGRSFNKKAQLIEFLNESIS